MARIIPEGSVEIQTGLYLYEYESVIGTMRKLYSSEGYCFYDIDDEHYDEEGNLIPPEEVLPEQRTYAQYASLPIQMTNWTIEQLNAKFISVPVDPSYEIVSVGQQTETI